MNADQVQATASVAATLLTGGVLWWEMHSRNRERRDGEQGQARTVVSEVQALYSGHVDDQPVLATVRVVVTNHSAAPILNLAVTVGPAPDLLPPHEPAQRATSVVPPGGTADMRYDPSQPLLWPKGEDPPVHAIRVKMIFTDASGLQWTRVDNNPPRRWIDPTRPVWWLRARYRVEATLARARFWRPSVGP